MTAIITPYLDEKDVEKLRDLFWEFDFYDEFDAAGIGSDMMYQKLWTKANDDVIIFHSDMLPMPYDIYHDWFASLEEAANKYPEAGMFGCLLLYPEKDKDDNYIIQSAGGKFTEGRPDHFGSGLELYSGKQFKELEVDIGQYDYVREVAWTTFGGLYIRKQVLQEVGNFDPSYEWTYNRDVDYCLETRKRGWKIYQVPVRLQHFEAKDNKKIRSAISRLNDAEGRNLVRLQKKWGETEYMRTINRIIE